MPSFLEDCWLPRPSASAPCLLWQVIVVTVCEENPVSHRLCRWKIGPHWFPKGPLLLSLQTILWEMLLASRVNLCSPSGSLYLASRPLITHPPAASPQAW
jgi:hypothetical protein